VTQFDSFEAVFFFPQKRHFSSVHNCTNAKSLSLLRTAQRTNATSRIVPKMDQFAFVSLKSRRLENQNRSDPEGLSLQELKEETIMLGFIILLLLCIVIICIFILREILMQYVPCCREMPTHLQQGRELPDEDMDVNINGNLARYLGGRTIHPAASPMSPEEEADREQRILTKRAERRSWYEYALKSFTHVVREKDLIGGYDAGKTHCALSDEGNIEPSDCSVKIKCRGKVKCRRVVDGSCAICICHYQVGDKIVVSPLEDGQCVHGYHYECMMMWLSKGKKRCPICRHWFVPTEKIADQIAAEFGPSPDMTV